MPLQTPPASPSGAPAFAFDRASGTPYFLNARVNLQAMFYKVEDEQLAVQAYNDLSLKLRSFGDGCGISIDQSGNVHLMVDENRGYAIMPEFHGGQHMDQARERFETKLVQQLQLWGVSLGSLYSHERIDGLMKDTAGALRRGGAAEFVSQRGPKDTVFDLCQYISSNPKVIAEAIADAYPVRQPRTIVVPFDREFETTMQHEGLDSLKLSISGNSVNYQFEKGKKPVEGTPTAEGISWREGRGLFVFPNQAPTTLHEMDPGIPDTSKVQFSSSPARGIVIDNLSGQISLSKVSARNQGVLM